jgi:hypothetical protein
MRKKKKDSIEEQKKSPKDSKKEATKVGTATSGGRGGGIK